MAVSVGEIVATLQADTRQFQQGLRQAQQSLAQMGQAAQQASQQTTRAMQGTTQGLERTLREVQRLPVLGQELRKLGVSFDTTAKQSHLLGQALQDAVVRRGLSPMAPEVQRITAAFRALPPVTEQSVSGIRGLTSAFSSLRGTLAAIGIATTARELIQLASSVIQVSTQMQGMQTAFRTLTGSAAGSQASLAFVRQEANRLGIDFMTAAESFKGITAAAKGTILEGQGAKEIFLGIAEASRVMGSSQEKTHRAFMAIQQAIAKGRLQGEELTQQLAEALPQATQVFGRALGVTTGKLLDMMRAGDVALPELLKFGTQLRREVAGGVTEASQKFDAATARMRNAWKDLLAALGNIITQNPRIIQAMNQMADSILALIPAIQEAGRWFAWLLEQREKVSQWLKAHPIVAKAVDMAVFGPDLFGGDTLQQQIQEINHALDAERQKLQELKATADQKPLEGAVGAEAQAAIARTQQAIAQLQGQLQVLRARPLVEEAPTSTIGIQEAQQQITAAEQRLEALRAKAANVAAGFPDLGGLSAKALEGQIKFTEALIANFQGKLDALQMPPLTDAQTTAEIQRVEQELAAAHQQLRALAQEADKQSVAKAFGQHTRNEIAQTEARITSLLAQLQKLQSVKMPDVTIAPTAVEFGGLEKQAGKTMREQLREQLKSTVENTARLDDYKKVLTDIALVEERLAQNKQLKFLSPQEVQVATTQLKQLQETEKGLREGRQKKGPKGFDFAKELEKDLRSLEALQQIAEATGLPIDTLSQKISVLSSALQQQLREGAKIGSASIQMLIEMLRKATQEAGEAEAKLTLDRLREQFPIGLPDATPPPVGFEQGMAAATLELAGHATEAFALQLQKLNAQREQAARIGDVERLQQLNQAMTQLTAETLQATMAQIEQSGARPLEALEQQLQALEAARATALQTPGQQDWVKQLDQDILNVQNRILNFEIGNIPAMTEAFMEAGIIMNDLELTATALQTALTNAIANSAPQDVIDGLKARLRTVKDQLDETYSTKQIEEFSKAQDKALREFAVQQRSQMVGMFGEPIGKREGLLAERERVYEAQAKFPGVMNDQATQQSIMRINAELGRTTILGKGIEIVAQGIGDAFDQSLQGVIQGTLSVSEAFENMVQSILLSIGKLLVQEGIATILRIVLAGIGSGISGGISGGVSGGAGGGMDFSSAGSASYGAYPGYQHGGIVKKPVVALMGEAGTEVILPMDDLPKHMLRILGKQRAQQAASEVLALGGNRRLKFPAVAMATGGILSPTGSVPLSSSISSGMSHAGRNETTLNNYTIVVNSQQEADAKAAELRQMENTVVSIVNRELMKGSGSGMNRLLKSTLR